MPTAVKKHPQIRSQNNRALKGTAMNHESHSTAFRDSIKLVHAKPLETKNSLAKRWARMACAAVVAWAAVVLSAAGAPLGSWSNRVSGTSLDIRGLAFGKGTFAAVATGCELGSGPCQSTVVTSSNGVEWTTRWLGTNQFVTQVAYGHGVFIAVGRKCTSEGCVALILRSTNGLTWSEVAVGAGPALYGIAWGNGRFVAVGEPGGTVISPDGLRWVRRGTNSQIALSSIAHGKGRFVASEVERTVIDDTTRFFTSADGRGWTARGPLAGVSGAITAIAYGRGHFVAVGGATSAFAAKPTLWTSRDGRMWTNRSAAISNTWLLAGVAYGQGRFVAVGTQGAVWTSSDAINWFPQAATASNQLQTVAFGNCTFVAAGEGGEIVQSGNPELPPSLVDQQQPLIDLFAGSNLIGGEATQRIAQVATAGMSGLLTEVRFPVACDNADLVIEVQGVTNGLPDGIAVTRQGISGYTIWQDRFANAPGDLFRRFVLSAPVTLSAGQQFAIVLGVQGLTPWGGCELLRSPPSSYYPGGDAYLNAWPNPANVWGMLGDMYDVPFQTLMSPAELDVPIDVQPGRETNVARFSVARTISVAILSGPDFNAGADVDRSSLRFGRTGEETSLIRVLTRPRDWNGDGLEDLVCTFRTSQLQLCPGDNVVVLKGRTIAGAPFRGVDTVRVLR